MVTSTIVKSAGYGLTVSWRVRKMLLGVALAVLRILVLLLPVAAIVVGIAIWFIPEHLKTITVLTAIIFIFTLPIVWIVYNWMQA